MGNFEKLVVLTVLFLTAIVLAVSLNGDDVEAGSPDPLAGEEGVEVATEPGGDSGSVVPTDPAPDPEENLPGPGAGRDPGLLLDSAILEGPDPAEVERTESPVEEERPAPPPGPRRILVNDAGLRAAAFGDYMVYTVRENDTWAGLAQRFFRNTSYLGQLHSANEEMDVPVPGEDILVPVYDLSHDAGIRAPLRPVANVTRPVLSGTNAETTAATTTTDVGTAATYEVQDGDNLSEISQKVYGTAHRWKEIYEANRDVLDSPDWVRVGMKLRIPR